MVVKWSEGNGQQEEHPRDSNEFAYIDEEQPQRAPDLLSKIMFCPTSSTDIFIDDLEYGMIWLTRIQWLSLSQMYAQPASIFEEVSQDSGDFSRSFL